MGNLNDGQTKILMNKAKEARKQKFLESSRRRLDKIVSTKITTTFIGAIAAFEEEFGFLWGHNLNEYDLTEEQLNMRDLWNKARTRILNSGNNQVRAASNEIANHMVCWNRHTIEFDMTKNWDSDYNYEPRLEN